MSCNQIRDIVDIREIAPRTIRNGCNVSPPDYLLASSGWLIHPHSDNKRNYFGLVIKIMHLVYRAPRQIYLLCLYISGLSNYADTAFRECLFVRLLRVSLASPSQK